QRHRPGDPGARRAGRFQRHPARADVPRSPLRPALRRPRRGPPGVGRPPAAQGSELCSVGMTAVDDAIDALRPALAEALGADRLVELQAHPLSAGASRLTWALDVRTDGATHRLVLQRPRVAGRGRMDVETEARLLRAAYAVGVPAPVVVACGSNVDGAYLV